MRRTSRESLALAGVALVAGVAVYALATWLFPYHSINHDEGVYLQQAAMLLDGKLWLEPPVPEAVRPWFFVEDGGRLYSKYTPVAAALFAPGLAVGAPRVVLGIVATANVALVGLLAREAFDARAAPVAAALFATAPLFLLSSSVFLSYAPTTLFSLLFALGYVRALRRESPAYAALAGAAVGVAYYSRPFSALLFASPFVGHALVTLVGAWLGYRGGERSRHAVLALTERLGIVGALGTAFVLLTLAYNALLTGDPLVFPYEAFAPRDGVGFGHRQILDHERVYTPELALRANALVLWAFLTRWGPLGFLGTVLAGVGLLTGLGGPMLRGLADSFPDGSPVTDGGSAPLPDRTCRALVAGVALSVAAGNVFFWGNLNVLAALDDPTDGLIAFLGPFYHFDLLVPFAVFGAAGALAVVDRAPTVADRAATAIAPDNRQTVRRVLVVSGLLLALVVAGGVESAALGPPVDRNAEYRDDVATAYAPFESTDFENALVFVPTPFGEWLNHPFQWLRNDGSFDGDAVYVMDRAAAGDAASLAAFGDRSPYRFTYRGSWPPDEDGVTAAIQPLSVREGDRFRIRTRVGVVPGAQSGTVRLSAGNESVLYGVDEVGGESTTVEWVVEPDHARVASDDARQYSDADAVTVDGPTELSLSVTLDQPGGGSVTYRHELTVLGTEDGVRVLWPPRERVCALTADCGYEGTYLAGGDYPTGVSMNATLDEEKVD